MQSELGARQQCPEMFHDSRGCFSVPPGRNRAFLPLAGHQAHQCRARIGSDQLVGSDRDGFRSLGVVAQGQAGPLQQLESFELTGGSIKGDGRLTAAQAVG